MPYTIAIDLDGTILDWDKGQPYHISRFGPLMPGAKRFMEEVFSAGCRIIIHTCRTSPHINNDMDVKELESMVGSELQRLMLPYHEIWTGVGKPIADLYIDDRAVRFTDWDAVKEFMERTNESD